MTTPTKEREEERATIDAWLKRRCERLKEPMARHVLKGKSLDDPEYRRMLGQSQAYMAARSFIHGHFSHHLNTTKGTE